MIGVYLLYIYILLGLSVGVWFAFFKVQQIDAGAEDAPFAFRLLLMPGAMLLWPYIIFKTIRK
jgi:hypothetical protein